MRRRRKNTKKYSDIAPDEIFLDSRNAPQFDRHQFEGRLERPISNFAPTLIGIVFSVTILIFIIQLSILQIKNGENYAQRSDDNHLRHDLVFADRGIIYDRNGIELVWNEQNENDDFSLRRYSKLSGLSHVLGYIGYPLKDDSGFYYQNEYIGKDGVEQGFSEIISGKNGTQISEIDAISDLVSESVFRTPENGDDLILSIDRRVQHNLYEFIKDLALRVGFSGGAGVIMNIHNGEIIALTSYPEYSSQVLTDGTDTTKIQNYLSDEDTPFLNRATHGLYTPGSIVKPFVALGALTEKIITPEKKILSTGSISIQNPYDPELFSIFKDWKAHGLVNMRDAISVSSNVYFYEVGGGYEKQEGLGISRLEKYIKAFGIGDRTGVEGLTDSYGVVPNPEWKKANFEDGLWRLGDTYNTAIGQYGFQVTPIQMARAVAVIANNGKLVVPKININEKTIIHSIPVNIKDEDFKVAQEGMRQSVTTGISQGVNLSFVKVAAKTGTAELGTVKQLVNSWVTGFFPYDNPKYSFAVVMEKGPRSNLTGAIFVMRNLFEWINLEVPEYLK